MVISLPTNICFWMNLINTMYQLQPWCCLGERVHGMYSNSVYYCDIDVDLFDNEVLVGDCHYRHFNISSINLRLLNSLTWKKRSRHSLRLQRWEASLGRSSTNGFQSVIERTLINHINISFGLVFRDWNGAKTRIRKS